MNVEAGAKQAWIWVNLFANQIRDDLNHSSLDHAIHNAYTEILNTGDDNFGDVNKLALRAAITRFFDL